MDTDNDYETGPTTRTLEELTTCRIELLERLLRLVQLEHREAVRLRDDPEALTSTLRKISRQIAAVMAEQDSLDIQIAETARRFYGEPRPSDEPITDRQYRGFAANGTNRPMTSSWHRPL